MNEAFPRIFACVLVEGVYDGAAYECRAALLRALPGQVEHSLLEPG